MPRRPQVRVRDLSSTLEALRSHGIEPCALDLLPDGTHRWHFTKPADNDEDELDRELAEYRAKHGYS